MPPEFSEPSPENISHTAISHETADRTTVITQDHVHAEIRKILEGPVGGLLKQLFGHFRKRFSAIQAFLRNVNINRHGPAHQARVAGIALAIGREFQQPEDDELSDGMLLAAAIPAFGHDLGYEPSAHPKGTPVSKHDVDYHPARSALMWSNLVNENRFDDEIRKMDFCPEHELQDLPPEELQRAVQEIAGQWTERQKEVSIRSAWHHSNGSDYDREKVPLADKLVRFADKIDMKNRVDHGRLVPGLREAFPHTYFHQTVPASIRAMNVAIDHQAQTLSVIYDVNTTDVSNKIDGYGSEDFLGDFDRAYKKAMERGAEVVQSLFEYQSHARLSDDVPWLTVRFRFPDGSEAVKSYQPERAA